MASANGHTSAAGSANHSDPTITDHAFPEDDAAKFLNNSPRTLQRWRALRQGPPYIKLGARVYYPKDELLRWALSQRATA